MIKTLLRRNFEIKFSTEIKLNIFLEFQYEMLISPNFHENVKIQSFQSFDKRMPQILCNADELSKAASLYNNMLKTSVIWKL